MQVRVLVFASYADALGTDSVVVEAPEGVSAGQVLDLVRSRIGGPVPPRPMMAINAAYAPLDAIVSPGDEVAIIPPVAGG
jgi:molybdopterin converting factor small subunit